MDMREEDAGIRRLKLEFSLLIGSIENYTTVRWKHRDFQEMSLRSIKKFCREKVPEILSDLRERTEKYRKESEDIENNREYRALIKYGQLKGL